MIGEKITEAARFRGGGIYEVRLCLRSATSDVRLLA